MKFDFVWRFCSLASIAGAFSPISKCKIFQSHLTLQCSIKDLENVLFDKINKQFDLKRTDYTNAIEMSQFNLKSGESEKECIGTADWYDEKKGSKLTGVSRFSIADTKSSNVEFSIDIWMGPGYMVPHMLLCLGSTSVDTYFLKTDYFPRGPTPFGSDQNYLDLYYNTEVFALQKSINSSPLPPSTSFAARLVQSPAYSAITGLSLTDLETAATQHVDRWLQWMAAAKTVEARQRGAINSRDDKLRQFYFRGKLESFQQSYGAQTSKAMAAAFTGPLAEAYIGGGS
jgi:hypothetical protein